MINRTLAMFRRTHIGGPPAKTSWSTKGRWSNTNGLATSVPSSVKTATKKCAQRTTKSTIAVVTANVPPITLIGDIGAFGLAAAASLADERARRRAALLASCEEADRREEAEQSCKLEKARKDAEAAGVTQAEGRAWMDAAKQGQVATLTAMIKENKRVLAYRGQGTSYSLMGHTALHWVCAKGHVQAAKMLIDSGLDANAVNNGGTHALFSAAAHGQASTARFLLVYGKCNAKLQDEFGNTAREEAVTRKKNDVVGR